MNNLFNVASIFNYNVNMTLRNCVTLNHDVLGQLVHFFLSSIKMLEQEVLFMSFSKMSLLSSHGVSIQHPSRSSKTSNTTAGC